MTMIAAVTMHDFWHYHRSARTRPQFGIFAATFAICGGLLLLVGWAGPFACESRQRSAAAERNANFCVVSRRACSRAFARRATLLLTPQILRDV
jgi:hypothetical protein